MEAYRKTKTKAFFDITIKRRAFIEKHYSLSDPRTWITTGEVRQILKRQGLVIKEGQAVVL